MIHVLVSLPESAVVVSSSPTVLLPVVMVAG